MRDDIPAETIELIELLLEGHLDPAGQDRLVELTTTDPQMLKLVSEHLQVSSSLNLAADAGANFVQRTADHVLKIANEGEFDFARRVKKRLAIHRTARIFAVAAVVALAMAPFAFHYVSKSREIATVVRFDGTSADGIPQSVRAGDHFEVSSGLIRMDFKNGAVAAIEAPLKVTILSGMEIHLQSGRLNAWCPDSAHGFKVRTSTAVLTDLGTSFGISASEQGKSEFIVLDGLVEVEKGGEKIRVKEGNAIEARTGNLMKSVIFDASGFKKTWPISNGILSTRGAVIPADPDTPEKLSLVEDNYNVLVIPEKRNVPFQSAIQAEIIGPGSLPGNIDGVLKEIAPLTGKRLSSFLIRYNPVGTVPEAHFLKFEGEVTFDRPVLAIAAQRDALTRTDAMFATGAWVSEFRGIELEQLLNPSDSVTLSDDRKTVKVVFYAGASTDEVRVILEDN